MNKEQIVNLVIERAWYKSILDFIQRAYKISDEEMTRYINGCAPNVTEKDKEQIIEELELEETKTEEKQEPVIEQETKTQTKVKESVR